MREFTCAAIVAVGYTNHKGVEEKVDCVVPTSWLGSREGLADAFIRLRAGLLPQPKDGQENEAWDTFHVAKVVENTEYLVEGDRNVGSAWIQEEATLP